MAKKKKGGDKSKQKPKEATTEQDNNNDAVNNGQTNEVSVQEEVKVEEPVHYTETTNTSTEPVEEDKVPHEESSKKGKVEPPLKTKPKRRGSKFDIQFDTSCPLLRPEFVYSENEDTSKKFWSLMETYQGTDIKSIQRSIVNHVEYTLAMTRFNFTNFGCYEATAFFHSRSNARGLERYESVFHNTQREERRLMQNNLNNLDMEGNYKDALMDIGYKLEDLYDQEVDPALGNGGLGRLAACFLDSMATLEIPAWGYGIRYDYGIFKQVIKDGYQCEIPDYWLSGGNPWEIERPEVAYPIRFYGYTEHYEDDGVTRAEWKGGETVVAKAYDTPIPGYNTFNTNNLRLWKSIPASEFDFSSFNQGNYFEAVEAKQRAEYITSVLYPNDSTDAGKELRLKQQYFFCAATMRDVIRRFKKMNSDWKEFPNKAAIQLNDTHPAIAAIEFLRILQFDY